MTKLSLTLVIQFLLNIIYFSAFNPRLRKGGDDENDKIDLFGDNPDWEPGWVKAYRLIITLMYSESC